MLVDNFLLTAFGCFDNMFFMGGKMSRRKKANGGYLALSFLSFLATSLVMLKAGKFRGLIMSAKKTGLCQKCLSSVAGLE